MDGISLLNWTKSNDSSENLDLAHQFAYDVISALEFLHGNGINHNDITPANILLIKKPGVSTFTQLLDEGALENSSKQPGNGLNTSTGRTTERWPAERALFNTQDL